MSCLKCAIDLLWVRHNQVGGIESVARNLLDGFTTIEGDFEFWLLVSEDNAETFSSYKKDPRFHMEICGVKSANVAKRIIWQNLHLGKKIKALGLATCLEPYYCKPVLGTRGIAFTTIIHDLQALHYPEYFSLKKNVWMRMSWKTAIRSSKKIVAISEYVRNDILSHYKVNPQKVVTIYNPVVIDDQSIVDEKVIEKKYGVKTKEYFFTVSSLLPHKNIDVLIDVMSELKKNNIGLPSKLIVSGIGGKSRESLLAKINSLYLSENIVFTPYIDDDERNALYKNCRAFLFPSLFEGFGMPPIEAIIMGAPVVTTRKTSLGEVTQGKVNYVENPHDVSEWIETIKTASFKTIDLSKYDIKTIALKYLETISTDLKKGDIDD